MFVFVPQVNVASRLLGACDDDHKFLCSEKTVGLLADMAESVCVKTAVGVRHFKGKEPVEVFSLEHGESFRSGNGFTGGAVQWGAATGDDDHHDSDTSAAGIVAEAGRAANMVSFGLRSATIKDPVTKGGPSAVANDVTKASGANAKAASAGSWMSRGTELPADALVAAGLAAGDSKGLAESLIRSNDGAVWERDPDRHAEQPLQGLSGSEGGRTVVLPDAGAKWRETTIRSNVVGAGIDARDSNGGALPKGDSVLLMANKNSFQATTKNSLQLTFNTSSSEAQNDAGAEAFAKFNDLYNHGKRPNVEGNRQLRELFNLELVDMSTQRGASARKGGTGMSTSVTETSIFLQKVCRRRVCEHGREGGVLSSLEIGRLCEN